MDEGEALTDPEVPGAEAEVVVEVEGEVGEKNSPKRGRTLTPQGLKRRGRDTSSKFLLKLMLVEMIPTQKLIHTQMEIVVLLKPIAIFQMSLQIMTRLMCTVQTITLHYCKL